MDLVRGGRIGTIDGLRGIAIVLVVWFHVWQIGWQNAVVPWINLSFQPLAETGFLGVALFFFISGFVLLLPYAQAHLSGETPPTLRHFFGRRFLKIVPSYVLCIAIVLIFAPPVYTGVLDAVRDISFHLLFIHNWFGTTNASIDGVLWSLGVEIQFYVLFPLLVLAFVRKPLTSTFVMFAIANAWRIWCVLTPNHFYLEQRLAQLPGYIDFFAAGMLAAFAYAAIALRRPELAKQRWWFTALSAAGIVAFLWLANDCYVHRTDPEWPQAWVMQWRSAVALACFATALGSLFAVRGFQVVLANRLLLFLAAISYNLYLWHQLVANQLLKLRFLPFGTLEQHNDARLMLLYPFVAVPVAIGIAALITYAFEQPILRLGKRRPELLPTVMPIAPETLLET
ncbi:MAG TPA: acyltransferase [Candidatus Elarobacter sp.]|jgi:peptidoglycan/LPS O-acetylase OafA/YrhL|nr:acyltransferase [Candidatus Elarobacter sp.]